MFLESFPRTLHASALPSLRRLGLYTGDCGNRWMCPELDGLFQHLDDGIIESVLLHPLTVFELKHCSTRRCSRAGLAHALQRRVCRRLTHLSLRERALSAHKCKAVAEALRKHACPHLTSPTSPSQTTLLKKR